MNTPQMLRHATLVLLAAFPGVTLAQDAKPLEWVVGYPAGGGSDVVARFVGEAMAKSLGRPVIVNNKPGGATNIAADHVAKSKDCGNVIFTADIATLAANPALFSKLSYDAERDFAPVGLLARFPMLLVVAPNVPAKNYKEFLAWAKAAGSNGVNYASAGAGSPHHLAGEMLRQRSGLAMTHVPYRGAAPAVQDLIGGQVPVAMMDTASVLQHLGSGRLRAIGVASPQRHATRGHRQAQPSAASGVGQHPGQGPLSSAGARSLSGLGMGPRRGEFRRQFRRRRGRDGKAQQAPRNEPTTTSGAENLPRPSGWTGVGADAALQRLAGCPTRLRFAPCLHPHSDPTRTHPQARQAPRAAARNACTDDPLRGQRTRALGQTDPRHRHQDGLRWT